MVRKYVSKDRTFEILPVLSKILEGAVIKQIKPILYHFENHDLFDSSQDGFGCNQLKIQYSIFKLKKAVRALKKIHSRA